jgi:uncharacterized protein (TIGR03382 family)
MVGQAQAFIRTPASTAVDGTQICVTWNRRDFTYHVDAAGNDQTPGDTEFTAIDSAFATWQALSDTCSDFTFTRGARVSNPIVGQSSSSSNVVTFRQLACATAVPSGDPCLADEGACGNAYKCWDHSDGTIALTTVTYSTKTGIAVDADVELNAVDFLLTSVSSPPCVDGKEAVTCVAYDIQNTMTHEIGHVVGFAHTLDDPGSLMYPTAPLGETSKRVIDPGTATGFCTTYPRGQPPVPCDEQLALQRHLIATTTCGSTDAASVLPFLALVLVGVTIRRHWRR